MVLAEMARLYAENPDQVGRIASEMSEYLDRTSQMPPPQRSLRGDWLDRVAAAYGQVFDDEHAGPRGAPKFPPHGLLTASLAHWRVSGDAGSLDRVTATLDAMARGGMYDLLAGGFARYSVDAEWRVPHFEKMLYDNGQLVAVYLDAFVATGNRHYERVVRETVDWMLREMRVEGGAFAASTDADSEGVEGRFFAWTPKQLTEVLGEDGSRAAQLLQVTPNGTFEHGTSVLRLEEPLERLHADDRALLERVLPKLLAARSERVAPGRDDKVIVAWNGLAIGAIARAGAVLGEPEWVESAATAARFLLDTVTVEGRLMRTYKDGRAHVLACADDHANLLAALLDLWEATFDQRWLLEANALADRLVALFWDDVGGGLFFTGSDAPALVTRSKNLNGGAEPSANGVASLCFVKLARLCGREDLGERAATILGGLQPTLIQVPRALGVSAIAGHWWTNGGLEIGLAADVTTPEGAALLAEVRKRYLPTAVVAARAKDEPYRLLPWLLGKTEKGGPTAYVCQGYTCKLPTTDPAELGTQLDEALQPTVERSVVRVHAPDLPREPELWLNGGPFDLEGLRGNVVVLDFWTYCCINCMHVLPALAAVEERFADQPVVVIGVHSAKFTAEKDRENVLAAMERYGVRHPVVLDGEHAVWSQYAVRSWPTVVVLDPTGRVAWDQPGEVSAEVLTARVQDLLDEGVERGTLGEAAWTVGAGAEGTDGLRFPGKVSLWAGDEADGETFEAGFLYVSDSANGRVVELALTPGEDGWPVATETRAWGGFHDPQGTARWGDRLYVADIGSHQLLVVHLETGEVEVLAGTGRLGKGGSILAEEPLHTDLRSPWDVAVSGDAENHVVFVAMAGTHQLWVWLPDERRFGPLAGSGREEHIDGPFEEAALAQPSGLDIHGPYVFFADSEVSSVRALDLAERRVVTVVGQGLFDFGDVDGQGTEVLLQHPLDVAAAGNTVYVADSYNHKIKAIDLHDSSVRTLAGGAGVLWEPAGLDRLGDFLFVADTNHHRVVVIHRDSGELRPLVG